MSLAPLPHLPAHPSAATIMAATAAIFPPNAISHVIRKKSHRSVVHVRAICVVPYSVERRQGTSMWRERAAIVFEGIRTEG